MAQKEQEMKNIQVSFFFFNPNHHLKQADMSSVFPFLRINLH